MVVRGADSKPDTLSALSMMLVPYARIDDLAYGFNDSLTFIHLLV